MIDRLSVVEQYVRDTPSSRVLVVGSQYDADCRDIRRFLTANRVKYDWMDSELEPGRVSSFIPTGHHEVATIRRRCEVSTDTDRPRSRRGVGSPNHFKARSV
jgi:hypothetical protein